MDFVTQPEVTLPGGVLYYNSRIIYMSVGLGTHSMQAFLYIANKGNLHARIATSMCFGYVLTVVKCLFHVIRVGGMLENLIILVGVCILNGIDVDNNKVLGQMPLHLQMSSHIP